MLGGVLIRPLAPASGRHTWRRAAVAAAMAVVAGLAGCTMTGQVQAAILLVHRPQETVTPSPGVEPSASPSPSPTPAPSPSPTKPTVNRPAPLPSKDPSPSQTPSRWQWAPSAGPVLGTAGPLRRFQIAVERGLPVSVADLTSVVDGTLGDSRSWIAGNDVRLQHVGPNDAYNFIIFLASPATAYQLCLTAGVDIRINGQPYTSCRAGSYVVLNSDRYLTAVPGYGAPLDAYRAYMINHEVGHWLGHNHELCPAPGQPAPVMQQQTLGLQGCVPNSWPYLNGALYSGPPAP
jgi:hypothetical protein